MPSKSWLFHATIILEVIINKVAFLRNSSSTCNKSELTAGQHRLNAIYAGQKKADFTSSAISMPAFFWGSWFYVIDSGSSNTGLNMRVFIHSIEIFSAKNHVRDIISYRT